MRHVAERKQGRAASELVVDDCCGGLGGLEAVEAAAGGERRALGYFGEVLVEEHPGDELLARSDADLLVEVFGVVLDCVRREDERFGDPERDNPRARSVATSRSRAVAPNTSRRTVAERAALARSITIAMRPSDAEPGRDA